MLEVGVRCSLYKWFRKEIFQNIAIQNVILSFINAFFPFCVPKQTPNVEEKAIPDYFSFQLGNHNGSQSIKEDRFYI